MPNRPSLILASAIASICFASGASAAAADPAPSDAATVGSIPLGTAATTVSASDNANADEPSSQPAPDGWEFALTPYLWASGVSGDLALAEGESVDIDVKFTDILGNLKFAFMSGLEARNGRLVLLGDVIYLSMGTKTDGPLGFVDAKVDMQTFVGTGLVGYRVVDQGPLFLDLFGGGRVSAIDASVNLSGPLQTRERDKSKSAIAPVIGARFRAPLGDRWGLGLYGDVGGFGITADLSWQLMGTVQYDLSQSWRLSGGYRYFHVDQDKGNFDLDLALHGPIMGVSYRF